jgi:hypothetical protein
MINKWAWLVTTVEDGYSEFIDEYTNDLYSRNWLHEVWPFVTDRTIAIGTPQIKTLDDRFRAATVFDDGQSLSQFHRISQLDADDMWWRRRRPRLLVGNLGRSLREAGAAD